MKQDLDLSAQIDGLVVVMAEVERVEAIAATETAAIRPAPASDESEWRSAENGL